jgi:hypothetical protein
MVGMFDDHAIASDLPIRLLAMSGPLRVFRKPMDATHPEARSEIVGTARWGECAACSFAFIRRRIATA